MGFFYKYAVHIQQDVRLPLLYAVHFNGRPAVPGCLVGVFFPFGVFCVGGIRAQEDKQTEH